MFEQEKERGRKRANLSPAEKNDLVARLMFGEHWQKAAEVLLMLMEIWGIDPARIAHAQGGEGHEQS